MANSVMPAIVFSPDKPNPADQIVVRWRGNGSIPSGTINVQREFPLDSDPSSPVWHGHPEDFRVAAVHLGGDLAAKNPHFQHLDPERWYVIAVSGAHDSTSASKPGPACLLIPMVLPIDDEHCVVRPAHYGDTNVLREETRAFYARHPELAT